MKHQSYGQAPSSINSAHKEQDKETDYIKAAPEISKKLKHGCFTGKLIIYGIVELVVHNRDDDIGHKGQYQYDFNQYGILDQGKDIFKLLDHGGFFL